MKNTHTVINFIYFIWNYPYNWYDEVWKDEKWFAEHIGSKFKAYCNKYKKSETAFMRLFAEMSLHRQEKLVNWVSENYVAFSEFKEEQKVTGD